MTWTKLDPGAHVAMWCATEACWGIPFHRLEVDGVASNYCSTCRKKIELLNPPMENSGDTGNARAAAAMTGNLPVAAAPTPIEPLPTSGTDKLFQETVETINRQIRAAF